MKREYPQIDSGCGIGLTLCARHTCLVLEVPQPSCAQRLQTDETFDLDIIHRMGPEFYKEVSAPAIAKAKQDGEKYKDIRDSIRVGWQPEKRSARK